MEVHPGVFVSSLSAEEWEADPDVPGRMLPLYRDERAEAGVSWFPDPVEPFGWTLPARETFLVLEGKARIEIDEGPTLEFRAGDMGCLPAGTRARWTLTTPFKDFYVIG
jgi:uncharacterized cupin superfamily protein